MGGTYYYQFYKSSLKMSERQRCSGAFRPGPWYQVRLWYFALAQRTGQTGCQDSLGAFFVPLDHLLVILGFQLPRDKWLHLCPLLFGEKRQPPLVFGLLRKEAGLFVLS